MAMSPKALNLQADNLAFVFDGNVGVRAADLGQFLRRAATVGRSAGADLYVVGLHEGSLAVVFRVVRRIAKASIKEFKSSPIASAAAATALVGSVAAAISLEMTPRPDFVSPLAKAGAQVVEDRSVTQISVVTTNNTIIVMDEQRAGDVRRFGVERRQEALPSPDVRRLIASATAGDLSGTVLSVDGQLHFRPDGYRFLVPISSFGNADPSLARPGQHLVVWGQVLLRDSQPDELVIREARAG